MKAQCTSCGRLVAMVPLEDHPFLVIARHRRRLPAHEVITYRGRRMSYVQCDGSYAETLVQRTSKSEGNFMNQSVAKCRHAFPFRGGHIQPCEKCGEEYVAPVAGEESTEKEV